MADREIGRVALLSIHPRFAEAILNGEKCVELRRAAVASDVSHVLLYATAPVQAIIGWFEVLGVDAGSKTSVWNRHGTVAGVSRSEFRTYFSGARRAFAIRVGKVYRLEYELRLDQIPGVRRPPQSFQYVDAEQIGGLFTVGPLTVPV
jgi:predicted transcriptional regulator